jgi:hypothetical protein
VTESNPGDPGVSRIRLYPVTSALRSRIAELFDESGIKGYRALSDRTGGDISHETARRILTGQVLHIRYDTLVALADALHAPIAELIGMSLGAESAGPWTTRRGIRRHAAGQAPEYGASAPRPTPRTRYPPAAQVAGPGSRLVQPLLATDWPPRRHKPHYGVAVTRHLPVTLSRP